MINTLLFLVAVIIICYGLYYLQTNRKTQCRNCGAFMPKKAKSCPFCGYRIRESYDDPHQY